MSIKERLQEDWKQALKSKDKLKADTIAMTKAAILLVEKSNGIKVDDGKVIEILAREVKQRKESIAEFKKGNRQDLVDKTQAEVDIIMNYLPQQLSQEEIENIIRDAVLDIGASSIKDMGKVMSAISTKVKGRADGKLVSEKVKSYLSNIK